MSISTTLNNAQSGHVWWVRTWAECKNQLLAGRKLTVTIKPATRSTLQNSKLWAMLGELSDQVNWHGNKLTPMEWKWVMGAALKKQKVIPGIDGGFVVLGQETSKMTIAEMGELIELISAFGAQHNVRFAAPEYME